MDRYDKPLERRFFENREQEEFYVAVARGFKDATEMRSHFAVNPLRGAPGKNTETPNGDDDEDYYRRLIMLKLEDINE
jgi:hypothetical protein